MQEHRTAHACERRTVSDEAGPKGGNRMRGVGVQAAGGPHASAFQQNLAAGERSEGSVRGGVIDEPSWRCRWGVETEWRCIEDDPQAHDDVGITKEELQAQSCERIRGQEVARREKQKGVNRLIRHDAEQLRCTLSLRNDGVCKIRIALHLDGRSRGNEPFAGAIDQRDHVQAWPSPTRQRRSNKSGTRWSEGPSGDAMRPWPEAVSDTIDRRPHDGFVR